MNCRDMNSKMADMLFESDEMIAVGYAEAKAHLDGCAVCRAELDGMRQTMALLDAWEAPAANPYFLTRLQARLAEEREAAPAGWFERLRARFMYGSRLTLRPVAAMAMTAVLLVGGGTYVGVNLSSWEQPTVAPVQTAVVDDLQTLDNNAQVLDQLESLSSPNDNGDAN